MRAALPASRAGSASAAAADGAAASRCPPRAARVARHASPRAASLAWRAALRVPPAALQPLAVAPLRHRRASAAAPIASAALPPPTLPPLPSALDVPPLVKEVRHGVVGRSRFAVQLRREVRAAQREGTRHVLLRGEPGLHKDRLAALIHFGSAAAHAGAPLARLECQALKPSRLFGLADEAGRPQRPGALDWLAAQPRGGSLLLHGAHALAPGSPTREALAALLAVGTYRAVDRHGAPAGPPKTLPLSVRLLVASDAAADDLLEHSSVRADVAEQAQQAEQRGGVRVIKVPPLRVRRADLAATAAFALRLLVRERGRVPLPATAAGCAAVASAAARRGVYGAAPELSRGARHLLESADFANNDEELESLVRAALAHAAASAAGDGGAADALAAAPLPKALEADMLWSPAWSERLQRARADLFAAFPPLRAAMRSPAWPDALNWNFTRWVYPLVIAALMFGPQEREHNGALVVFWAWWWPLILVTYPVLGRLWCSVCPFMIYGEWAQKLAVAAGAVLKPWPKEAAETYGGWFLYALFAAILLWEDLWDLPNHAALSGWLLLLITAGAVSCSVVFERRLWCRYLCPIGGMNGMYAKLSVVELRAARGVCSAECSTYGCVRGGAGVPPASPGGERGLPTSGCPLGSHPGNLTDNRDCTLCGSCVKACPHGSVELRLRPPGADLWSLTQKATAEEVALMFLLLGAVGVHRLERAAMLTGDWLLGMSGQDAAQAAAALMADMPVHAGLSLLLLTAPGALAWGADAAICAAAAGARAAAAGLASGGGGGGATSAAAAPPPGWAAESPDGTHSFVRLAYAWLPFVWAASLAHFGTYFGAEALTILPATSDMLHLPQTVHDALPHAALSRPVVAFLQAAVLTFGGGASTLLTWHLGRALGYAQGRVAAQAVGIFGAGALLWPLLVADPFLQ